MIQIIEYTSKKMLMNKIKGRIKTVMIVTLMDAL